MKKVLIGILVFVVAVLLAVNMVGKQLLAKSLESAVGAPVKISNIYLNLFASKAGIYGLEIQNPAGFKEPTLASIPEVFVAYDLPSFFGASPRIREIKFNLDQITVEKSSEGKINMTQIGAVKGTGGESSKKEKTPEPAQRETPGKTTKPAPKLQIDRVDLTLGRVRYVDYSNGQAVSREFPLGVQHAILEHVTDPKQITQQVVVRTMQKVGLNAISPELGQLAAMFETQSAVNKDQIKNALNDFSKQFK